MSTKSLNDEVLVANDQRDFLSNGIFAAGKLPTFQDSLSQIGFDELKPAQLEILQVNVGYMCNQTCKHCHVDAGPDRKEIMDRETMQLCIDKIKAFDKLNISFLQRFF